jgi:hypothetical protein
MKKTELAFKKEIAEDLIVAGKPSSANWSRRYRGTRMAVHFVKAFKDREIAVD